MKTNFWTKEDVDILERIFQHGNKFDWTALMHDWYDAGLMVELTKLKGCPPAGKLVALRIKEAHKSEDIYDG